MILILGDRLNSRKNKGIYIIRSGFPRSSQCCTSHSSVKRSVPSASLILPASMSVHVKCDGILSDASTCLAENQLYLHQPLSRGLWLHFCFWNHNSLWYAWYLGGKTERQTKTRGICSIPFEFSLEEQSF